MIEEKTSGEGAEDRRRNLIYIYNQLHRYIT